MFFSPYDTKIPPFKKHCEEYQGSSSYKYKLEQHLQAGTCEFNFISTIGEIQSYQYRFFFVREMAFSVLLTTRRLFRSQQLVRYASDVFDLENFYLTYIQWKCYEIISLSDPSARILHILALIIFIYDFFRFLKEVQIIFNI